MKKIKHKSRGVIRHHQITKVMYIALVAVFFTTCLSTGLLFSAEPAQATVGMIPQGGITMSALVIPPTPTFTGICPAHVVILDETLPVPTLMGLAPQDIVGAGTGLTFIYNNLFTPGVWDLGEHLPIPIPSCVGFPYPVYFHFFNPEYLRNQIGTGLVPGF